MNKTVLITGGDGMVGRQATQGIRTNRGELDVLDPSSIHAAISRHHPDVLLHLAAMTDMLACEQNPHEAHQVNVVGTRNVALACQEAHVRLAYLSTCAVFDGTKTSPYVETDMPRPINVYGQTKSEGEKIAQSILPKTLIIRTGWLFGGGVGIDTKFVLRTLQKLQRGEEVIATMDRFGSPTYVPDLLSTVWQLIDEETTGIRHVVNDGVASYLQIAQTIKEQLDSSSPVKALHAQDIESSEVRRGQMEALASMFARLRPWNEAVKEYAEIVEILELQAKFHSLSLSKG